jgi:hypothetical protein
MNILPITAQPHLSQLDRETKKRLFKNLSLIHQLERRKEETAKTICTFNHVLPTRLFNKKYREAIKCQKLILILKETILTYN